MDKQISFIKKRRNPLFFVKKKRCTWEELANYKNTDLVDLFKERVLYANSITADADLLFLEFKKLLFILVNCDKVGLSDFNIFQQMSLLDEFWHLFILMTKEYSEFCNKYFGFYLHHSPIIKINNTSNINSNDYEQEIKKQINFVINVFGVETAEAWYLSGKFDLNKIKKSTI